MMPAIVKGKKEKVALVVASITDAVEFSITAILEFCSGKVHCNLHSHPFLSGKLSTNLYGWDDVSVVKDKPNCTILKL